MSQVEEYISQNFYIYEIQASNLATVFLGINRQSVDFPISFIQPDNSEITSPQHLKSVLNANSSYGGTRAEPPLDGNYQQSRLNAVQSLLKLAFYESHVKHKYLSKTNERGALDGLISPDGKIIQHLKSQNEAQQDIPKDFGFSRDFLKLNFQGGRVVILAKTKKIHEVIINANHPQAYEIYTAIFEQVGKFLNGQKGANKIDIEGNILEKDVHISPGALFITPDFGPNKKLADYAHEHTPQVLGVDASVGGGGGKAAYTVSGFFGAFDAVAEQGLFDGYDKNIPISLIGAAGAMGSDTAKRLAQQGFTNVIVSDIAYDYNQSIKIDSQTNEKLVPIVDSEKYRMNGEAFQRIPSSWSVVAAEPRQFTEEALGKNGKPRVIIAMTFGMALENSNFDAIPNNSILFLAENWSIPTGYEGLKLVKYLLSRSIITFPGQVITAGGAGNSKVEIFFRATTEGGITKAMANQDKPAYYKRLGHEIVYLQIKQGVKDLLTIAQEQNITITEALVQYTDLTAFVPNEVISLVS